jgi:superfamily II DNA or RNA helicase
MLVKHASKLVRAINKRAGETVAVAFTGGANRRDIIEGARSGKYKVVVGTRSIVSTGINVPQWSCLYEILPSSNIPNARQRLSRILTPMPGKKESVIKYFLDDCKLVRTCFASELYGAVLPHIKGIMSEQTRVVAKAYIAGKASKKNQINGEF